jgi:hypothetical protein
LLRKQQRDEELAKKKRDLETKIL